MQSDDVITAHVSDTAKRCLGSDRQASIVQEFDGVRILQYATRKRPGVIWMEICAYINPFNAPDHELSVEDDAPIDDSTGEPIPTERWLRHPPLVCFYMQNWDISRAAFGCHPETVGSILDEMEVEMQQAVGE